MSHLEAQLCAANPINVQPKHPATRVQLERWLSKQAPPEQAVHWDADAPFAAGQVVGQHYDPAMVRQLSDDLELDELRCLELIAQVVLKPEVRRIIEEELDLGAGVIESIDSPYYAALELFYLERGFLMRSLKELMIQSHSNSQTLSLEAKAELRQSLTQSLLQGGALAEGLRKTLVLLTHELRKTDPKAAGNNTAALVRRREFLRSERLHAAETLFFLCHSFGVEGCGPSLPEMLVAAMKDLSLDQAFFDPSRGSTPSTQQEDFDDRPGLVRCLGLLELALMHVLEKELPPAAANTFRTKLGLGLSGDEMVAWEGESGGSGPGDEVSWLNCPYLASNSCLLLAPFSFSLSLLNPVLNLSFCSPLSPLALAYPRPLLGSPAQFRLLQAAARIQAGGERSPGACLPRIRGGQTTGIFGVVVGDSQALTGVVQAVPRTLRPHLAHPQHRRGPQSGRLQPVGLPRAARPNGSVLPGSGVFAQPAWPRADSHQGRPLALAPHLAALPGKRVPQSRSRRH